MGLYWAFSDFWTSLGPVLLLWHQNDAEVVSSTRYWIRPLCVKHLPSSPPMRWHDIRWHVARGSIPLVPHPILAAVTVRLAVATKRAGPPHFFSSRRPFSSITHLSLSSRSWSPRFSLTFSLLLLRSFLGKMVSITALLFLLQSLNY